MADKPILFSAPMVRALLAGTKTQTRRLLKPQPPADSGPLTWTAYHPTKVDRHGEEYPGPLTLGASSEDGSFAAPIRITPCDRLWVRETWRPVGLLNPWDIEIIYNADGERHRIADGDFDASDWTIPKAAQTGNVSPLFMPRWASRLTLTVTDVRVQRLQDISEEDAIAEGIVVGKPVAAVPTSRGDIYHDGVTDPIDGWTRDPVEAYRTLWEHINGDGAWDANPWVVAYSFTVERRNIDAEA